MYMLHEIQFAVNASPGLTRSIANWHEISAGLKEPPRKRKRQHEILQANLAGYNILY